ncbi:hypothetical protein DFP72DRAFT_867287 [Ephemerocybe angulata]|uniref:Uncharacterized protein n=1 Tax=Ephemerocybe angulata TaxID=980116 RepID=A0A8H6IKY9_9AGAR|nr:hypothetical protein DFP72DRAFT_867287 [Tulosesus angulatus]
MTPSVDRLGNSTILFNPKHTTHSPIQDLTPALKDVVLQAAASSQETLVETTLPSLRRRLGDTEASYFLPSRESGVNDMYLMLGLNCAAKAMSKGGVNVAWAILRCRHPLLASSIDMENYQDVFFKYSPPPTVDAALSSAETSLEYRTQTSDELLNDYLNGPRTLSNERLSYLIVSSAVSNESCGDEEVSFDLLICSTHFLGDGMALHQFAHEFLSLLGNNDEHALLGILESEVSSLTDSKPENAQSYLPLSLESQLPPSPASKFHAAATLVDHLADQRRQIGGHSFPRRSAPDRRTMVPTLSYNADKTKSILKKCKENGVSISSAIFALCNIAWARTGTDGWELPMMMYSALNIRPHLQANERLNKSYFFLCIGFFNIILPSFLPIHADHGKIFWHRARSVKAQTAKIAKSPSLISRSKEMAKERGTRARMWAMQDDGVECTMEPLKSSPLPDGPSKAPSRALIGLSMLGNLDGIYKHPSFPSIKLHTLTTGSRQRHGGTLLFGYTFVGKLWLSLGYDVNGFEEGVVQTFWHNLLTCVDEFLL